MTGTTNIFSIEIRGAWLRYSTFIELENFIGDFHQDNKDVHDDQDDDIIIDFQLTRGVSHCIQWGAHLLGDQWTFCGTLLSRALLWEVSVYNHYLLYHRGATLSSDGVVVMCYDPHDHHHDHISKTITITFQEGHDEEGESKGGRQHLCFSKHLCRSHKTMVFLRHQ